jgi:hypothetical protein
LVGINLGVKVRRRPTSPNTGETIFAMLSVDAFEQHKTLDATQLIECIAGRADQSIASAQDLAGWTSAATRVM